MKEDVLFKKTPFGGFDRVEVIGYIQQLKKTQQTYKSMLEDKEEANKKLIQENKAFKECADEDSKKIAELEKQLAVLNSKVNAKNDVEQLVGDAAKMCDELVETASKTADELVKNAEKKINSAVRKIKRAKTMTPEKLVETLDKLAKELKENG